MPLPDQGPLRKFNVLRECLFTFNTARDSESIFVPPGTFIEADDHTIWVHLVRGTPRESINTRATLTHYLLQGMVYEEHDPSDDPKIP
jgi:hypothetical protein